MLKNHKDIDFKTLYSAKLTVDDLKRTKLIRKMKRDDMMVYPCFLKDTKEYRRILGVIAKTNFID